MTPEQVEQQLERILYDNNYPVIDVAVPGQTLRMLLALYRYERARAVFLQCRCDRCDPIGWGHARPSVCRLEQAVDDAEAECRRLGVEVE